MHQHLLEIEANLLKRRDEVLDYISKLSIGCHPIFTSLDIRNSGFKIAHVDANLFPAGFNNLNDTGRALLKTNIAQYLKAKAPDATRILIYVEDFTRNLKYIESVNVIKTAIEACGCEVKLGLSTIDSNRVLDDGTIVHALQLNAAKLATLDGFAPDLIILNNDLTSGTPQILIDCAQEVVPCYNLGWHSRSKANHFRIYNQLISKFCEHFGIDSWLLSTYFEDCDDVDFKTKKGLECLGKKIDILLQKITDKYKEYSISSSPYIFVKADKGTFGMGIMTVTSGDEIVNINKKNRHSMHVIKQGKVNEHLIIQEGIPTIEHAMGHSAETMAYMCNNECLEMFYRYNTQKDTFSNLNSPGMHFCEGAESILPFIKLIISKIACIATEGEKGSSK